MKTQEQTLKWQEYCLSYVQDCHPILRHHVTPEEAEDIVQYDVWQMSDETFNKQISLLGAHIRGELKLRKKYGPHTVHCFETGGPLL